MLDQQQIDGFDRDGFLTISNLLSADEVAELSDALDKVLATGPDGFVEGEPQPVSFRSLSGDEKHPVWQIVNIWEAMPAFEKLIYHPAIVEGISQLAGQQDLMVWHDQIQYKPAQYGGSTHWHQDAPLWPIIKPMTPVSAWIPFDDATEENGCMWMVPGSHKWGNQIEFLRTQGDLSLLDNFKDLQGFEPPADAEIRTIEAQPRPVLCGEVSFHHSLTWHGSPFNQSQWPRRAIAIHYMTGEARFDAGGNHIMKQFVDLPDNAPMAEAGAHFPTVCRDRKPLGVPERLRATST
ncbi:MAG TPA: phytanoyl-CoA dioxygenase family protein [Candidatus Latescibacteria bacterium]|nr:phytanoyl-CoA dioxygenase family protein [Candidatus Handelsmanbacteria bacterium]HIL08458.1 phytanoyl-CoA dioxygenase family protein [Candidatus Latescibacterota bacterium]